jgi:hypothetical protein
MGNVRLLLSRILPRLSEPYAGELAVSLLYTNRHLSCIVLQESSLPPKKTFPVDGDTHAALCAFQGAYRNACEVRGVKPKARN